MTSQRVPPGLIRDPSRTASARGRSCNAHSFSPPGDSQSTPRFERQRWRAWSSRAFNSAALFEDCVDVFELPSAANVAGAIISAAAQTAATTIVNARWGQLFK